MAGQLNGPSASATGREPKFRTSCDNCQTAKVKCGQGKPCRRCSVHRLQCVYSLSRRMGRPRTKKSALIGSSAEPASDNNDTINRDTRSIPSTPTAPDRPHDAQLDASTAAVTVARGEAAARPTSSHGLECWDGGEAAGIMPDDPLQELASWGMPGDRGIEPSLSSAIETSTAGSSLCQPMAEPMDLDGVSRSLEVGMASFLQTLSPSTGTHSQPPPISTAPYENLFGSPIDLLFLMSSPAAGNPDKNAPSEPLPSESDSSPQRRGQQTHFGLDPDPIARAAAASPLQGAAQTRAMNQTLDHPLFAHASHKAVGGSRTPPRGTCQHSQHSCSFTNPDGCRHREPAPLVSPPDTDNASLRRPSVTHHFSDGSFSGGTAARADGADGHGDEFDDEDEGGSADDDCEAACVLLSSPSPLSISHLARSSSPNEPDHLMPPSASGGGRADRQCGCISAVTRCIVLLQTAEQQRQQQQQQPQHRQSPASSPLPLDNALHMESEVAAALARLDRCRMCRDNGTIHLLALVSVRIVLRLLQRSVQDEFASRWRPPAARDRHTGSRTSDSSRPEGRGGAVVCIGRYKVVPRAQARFLRRLLQARFYRLAVVVEERKKSMGGSADFSSDCFAGASTLLLADVSQGLQTAMGLLELWNSNP